MPQCQICKREGKGLGWYDIEKHGKSRKIHWACSSGCMYMIADFKGDYEVTTENEKVAIWDGFCAGGEYLDSIKKYSLDQLSKGEAEEFARICFETACNKLADIAADLDVPF